MNEIQFTVLMCTFYKDDPFLLEKAIDSVFNNNIKPNYFILTIDGQIPKSNKEVIKKMTKKYPIQINFIKENIGLALAINTAIKLVKTEWIARADSDDINLKKRFSKQIKFAKKNFDVIGSNILEIDKSGKVPNFTKSIPITNKEIKKYIKSRNPINHMTAFYKTEVIKSIGCYPDIYLREDYGLWAKLININASFYNIDEILVHVNGGKSLYRRRGGLKNALAEIKLQLLLFQCNIKPFNLFIFDLILRTTILLLPNRILEQIYISKLRKKVNK